jgi:hypothetical protein
MSWRLAYARSTRPAPSCAEAGIDEVFFEVHDPIDDSFQDFSLPCEAGKGTLNGLAHDGSHRVWAAAPKGAFSVGTDLFDDQEFSVTVKTGSTVPEEVDFRLSYIEASWTISKGGATVSCSDVDATKVRFLLMPPGNSRPSTYDIDCVGGSGETKAVPAGYYSHATASLIGTGGEILATTEPLPGDTAYSYHFDIESKYPKSFGVIKFTVR